MEILVADIGGTNARFAIASMRGGDISLTHVQKLRVDDYPDFPAALRTYHTDIPHTKLHHAVLALASPIVDDKAELTNGNWQFDAIEIATMLNCPAATLLNDFVAIGHAVARCGSDELLHYAGPKAQEDAGYPILVVGPGTGLGVSIVIGSGAGYDVIETEGGHIGFSPSSPSQTKLLDHFLASHDRVSVERVASGPALREISNCLFPEEIAVWRDMDDAALWNLALKEADSPPGKALDEFCAILGAAIGDIALATGVKKVVLAGNIANKISEMSSNQPFITGFHNKGRFKGLMEQLPVMLLTETDSGLQGAAAYYFGKPTSATRAPA